MVALLVTLHVLVCFIMIGVILLQSGKGAEIGAAFGGSSQTVFGSRGPGTFLSKLTVAAAVIFMLTALILSVLSGGQSVASKFIDLPAEEAPLQRGEPIQEGIPLQEEAPAPLTEPDTP